MEKLVRKIGLVHDAAKKDSSVGTVGTRNC